MPDAEEVFLNTKPARILVQLNNPSKENYSSQIARDIDCTYSHAVRIIQKLEEIGLIESQEKGRKKILKLTAEGEDIARILSELLHHLRQL